MKSNTIVNIIVVVIGAVLLASLAGMGLWWKNYTCDARWESSGMNSEYRYVSGCMVEVTPGKFIPEDKYRAVE